MTLRFPLIAAASLVAIALILAALACTRTVQVVVTPTPEQEDANRPAATQTANTLVPTATPSPTPTRRPTSTPRPTVTRQPTSTSLVRTTGTRTSSRRPTATPMVRALGTRTATRQPTATPRSRVSTTETERFMVDAGNTYHYTIQIADFSITNSRRSIQEIGLNSWISTLRLPNHEGLSSLPTALLHSQAASRYKGARNTYSFLITPSLFSQAKRLRSSSTGQADHHVKLLHISVNMRTRPDVSN